jgi:chitin synthase
MVACGIICILAAIGQVHNSYLDRNMIFSILITYGTWVISSALALDPWHLLTSAGQYTLLLPLYLVVLNM